MQKIFLTVLVIFSGFLLLHSCTTSKQSVKNETSPDLPQVMKEFRGAWIASVANINWPSKPGLSTEDQKKEALNLLDFLQKNNFNAAILQVRPQADALYKSEIEPWSYYLTGTQGKAPDPYYDPLDFWIKEAHERGLELHVWLNPYRAHHKDGKEISDKSIIKTNPELVLKLAEGYWWMDPAMKEVQDITNAVVMDIVTRYDIDAVHMDDYFYPYPSYNLNADFPDSVSWTNYKKNGGKLSRNDWRRDAVNKLIERLYKNIKAIKPVVKFGLSPFGIWRPGFPESIEGFDQYDQLYADARLWLNKGWIDYFTPQLYWPINRYPQSFPVLLGWWSEENKMNRHLWPGLSVGRDTTAKNTDEILNQIMISRGMLPKSKGVVHWSISSLTRNQKLTDTIFKSVYKKQAIVPSSPWLDKQAPLPPDVTTDLQENQLKINWTHTNSNDVFRWVVYFQYGNAWSYKILNQSDRSLEIERMTGVATAKQNLKKIIVTAVDRSGNESEKREITIN